ncbi:glycosyltransferase 87 family protein [Luteococcus sanguinis]|uniref:Glycosyltransferase 87 family protein n=2 Tax=Luteococcus sanguinis TaxID=174038 RepID=A0ABW1X461_9ACTN
MRGVWGRRAGVVVLAVLGALLTARYAWATWLARAPWGARYPYENPVMTDFRDTVMLPWRMIDAGRNPYDLVAHEAMFPDSQEFNPYGPWWLTAMHPIGRMGWDNATLAYSILLAMATSLGAFAAGWWMSRRAGQWGGLDLPPAAMGFAMVVLVWVWRPTSVGMGLGNVGSFAALCALLALLAPGTWWSALFLALAWVKPQYGIPLVVALVVLRRWRSAFAGTAVAGLASLPMVVKLSGLAGGFGALVRSVLDQTAQVGARSGGEPLEGRVDFGLWFALLGASETIALLIGVVLVAAASALALRVQRAGRPGAALLLVTVAVLVGFPHLHYDLTMLLPAVVWAGVELVQRADRRWGGMVGLLGLAIVLLIFIGIFPGALVMDGAHFSRLQAVLLGASALLIAVWALAIPSGQVALDREDGKLASGMSTYRSRR